MCPARGFPETARPGTFGAATDRRLTRQSKLPLGRIAVRECALRRHDKAVVEQALDAVGLFAFAVELDPTDQNFVAQRNEVGVRADLLVGIAEQPFPRLAVELDWPPHQRRWWRNFIQVGLLRRTRVRHCNRRGFCGDNSLVREPFDFVLWLLRGRLLRNRLSPCGQPCFALAVGSLLLLFQNLR